MKILKQEEWYHVGMMDVSKKGENSYEGHCLSVSQHPESWRRIARLGDSDTFRVHKENGQFLDAHALTDEQWKIIKTWGVEAGYLKEEEVFTYIFRDEEGEECAMELYSRSEWELESGWDEEDEEEQKSLEKNCLRIERLLTATDALKDAECWVSKKCPSFISEDLILIRYADEVLEIDGVYWEDNLKESSLSAPRAGIVRSRLNQWSIENMTSPRHEEEKSMFKMMTESTWYHVGSMDLNQKEDNPREGLTLSVSCCPKAWETSEGLEGDTYELFREGATFWDAHALTEEHWIALKRWGVDRGYLAEEDILVYTYEENGKVCYEEYFERKGWEGDFPFGDIDSLVLSPRLLATASLLEKEGWWNERCLSSVSETLLLVRYANEVLDVDGIFWGESLWGDVLPLSRAVILNSKLPQWVVKKEK